jgi:hypothetical protein
MSLRLLYLRPRPTGGLWWLQKGEPSTGHSHPHPQVAAFQLPTKRKDTPSPEMAVAAAEDGEDETAEGTNLNSNFKGISRMRMGRGGALMRFDSGQRS